MSFIAVIAGARPNFIKVAPLLKEFRLRKVPARLVHTGQHYDANMSDVFFQDLGIPAPDAHLQVGSSSHARQTAEIMIRYEEYCSKDRPDWTLVVGDVNSTVACSLVSAKLGIKVCHLEAGLRSRDWSMPEEINRVVTDRLSDLLLTTSPDANQNLLQEGVPADRIELVGNIMIDTLFDRLPKSGESTIHDRLNVKKGEYALGTFHRPSNVDSRESLSTLVGLLHAVADRIPLVLPLHPRTKARLTQFALMRPIEGHCIVTEPLGYLDFLALSSNAKLVLTDSGGLQEETTALGIPCLTLRENTERPITVTCGTNQLVGRDREKLLGAVTRILAGEIPQKRCPNLWDGKTASRCVDALMRAL